MFRVINRHNSQHTCRMASSSRILSTIRPTPHFKQGTDSGTTDKSVVLSDVTVFCSAAMETVILDNTAEPRTLQTGHIGCCARSVSDKVNSVISCCQNRYDNSMIEYKYKLQIKQKMVIKYFQRSHHCFCGGKLMLMNFLCHDISNPGSGS